VAFLKIAAQRIAEAQKLLKVCENTTDKQIAWIINRQTDS
jgi:hypothetical protein